MENSADFQPMDTMDHATFDAQLLHALSREGFGRWYLRPRTKPTSLTCDQIGSMIRQKIGAALPGISKNFQSHLSYTIERSGMAVHLEDVTTEKMLTDIRNILYHVATGRLVIVDEKNPLWKKAKPIHSERVTSKPAHVDLRSIDANRTDQQIAKTFMRNLQQIGYNPTEPIEKLLQETVPYMLTLDRGSCLELAFPLRKTLHGLLEDKNDETFTPDIRKQCVMEILDYWDKLRQSDETDDVVLQLGDIKQEELFSMDIEAIIEKILEPAVHDEEVLRERMKILELLSFHNAIEGNTELSDRLCGIWQAVFPYLKKAIFNEPEHALAYMASIAASRPIAKMRDFLGPRPSLTPHPRA